MSRASLLLTTLAANTASPLGLLPGVAYPIQTTVGQTFSPDGMNWSQADPLIVDSAGRVMLLGQRASISDHYLLYADNGRDVIESAPLITTATRGTMVLDAVNDILHIVWLGNTASIGIIYRQYTLTRDARGALASITERTSARVSLDNQNGGTGTHYQHPWVYLRQDAGDGTYGRLIVLWGIGTNTGGEVRGTTVAIGSNRDAPATTGNWQALNTSNSDTIGNAAQVAVTIVGSVASHNVYPVGYVVDGGTYANDLVVAWGESQDGTAGAWRLKRLTYASGTGRWTGTAGTTTLLSAMTRSGSDSGYTLKQELISKVVRIPSSDRLALCIAVWDGNTAGDTWMLVTCTPDGQSISTAPIYAANGAHSYAPVGDITLDGNDLIVSWIASSAGHEYAYAQRYRDTTAQGAATVIYNQGPVDIPLFPRRSRVGTPAHLISAFRRTVNTPTPPYDGHLIWIQHTPPTSQASAPAALDPATVSGIYAAYRASDLSLSNNAEVTSWTDASGNGRTATSSGGAGPTFKTSGTIGRGRGGPYLQFASDDYLTVNLALGSSHTIFLVVDPGGDGTLLGGANGTYAPYQEGGVTTYYRNGSGNSPVSVTTEQWDNKVSVLAIRRSGTSVDFWVSNRKQGTTQTLGANDTVTYGRINGQTSGSFAPGMDLYALYAYSTALSDDTLLQVIQALRDRYNLF